MSRGKSTPACGKLAAEILRVHGFEIGRNLEVRCVFLDDREYDVALLARKAKELVALKPDVIVTLGSEQTTAVGDQTATIPIVFWGAGTRRDVIPEGLGRPLAREFRKPGGNITGTTAQYLDLALKRLELARELLPMGRRVALLANYPQMRARVPGFPDEVQAAARGLGLEVVHADASKENGDVAATFARIMPSQPEAFMPYGEVNYRSDRFEVVGSMELRHRIPGIFDIPGMGVLALGPDWHELLIRAYHIAARILNGARPSDIPVEQPSRFLMTVNLGAARAIGLEVPRSLILRADRVTD